MCASLTFGRSVDQVTICTVPIAGLVVWPTVKSQVSPATMTPGLPVVLVEPSAPAMPPGAPAADVPETAFDPPESTELPAVVGAPPLPRVAVVVAVAELVVSEVIALGASTWAVVALAVGVP